MQKTQTCTWTGAKRQQYEYFVYPLPVGFNAGQIGNYIFAKFVNKRWHPIYFGEGDLGKRAGVSHFKAKDIIRHGATHVHVHLNASGPDRLDEEADLLANYTRAYAPIGCNERAGGYEDWFH